MNHEAPIKITETPKSITLQARYHALGLICFAFACLIAFLLHHLSQKSYPTPILIWIALVAMGLLLLYAGFDNLRTSKTLFIDKTKKQYVFTYTRKNEEETRKGPVSELKDIRITSEEDDGTLYFHVDLTVPEVFAGKFRLLATTGETNALDAQREWFLRLGNLMGLNHMGNEPLPNAQTDHDPEILSKKKSDSPKKTHSSTSVLNEVFQQIKAPKQGYTVDLNSDLDNLRFLPVGPAEQILPLPETARFSGFIMLLIGGTFSSFAVLAFISELAKHSQGLLAEQILEQFPPEMLPLTLFFGAFLFIGLLLAYGGALFLLTKKQLRFSPLGLFIERSLFQLKLASRFIPWKEINAVDLIDRNSGTSSPLRKRLSKRIFLRIQREETSGRKKRISGENISDGLSDTELHVVALAIRRWRKAYANVMTRKF